MVYSICGVRKNRPTASEVRSDQLYPQEVAGWSEVSTHFFVDRTLSTSDLRRLSHPVSQTGPSVVVGPTVPAQQKPQLLNETLLAKSTSQNPRKHDVIAEETLIFR